MRHLASAWDPAPIVLVGAAVTLALFACGFFRLRRRGRTDHAGWSRAVLFVVAVALGTVALVSPLDEVADSYLLSGHMLQHVLLGDAAPALAVVALRGPLLHFVLPAAVLRPLARCGPVRAMLGFLLRPATSFAVWIAVFGAWHIPAAYDYALDHPLVHDLEHLSFVVAGLLVWLQIVDPARRRRLTVPQRVNYMVGLFAAGALLAGMLLLSPAPLYPAYAGAGARLLGISPLRDQQLAGGVMLTEQLLMLGFCACFLLPVRGRSALVLRARVAPAQTNT